MVSFVESATKYGFESGIETARRPSWVGFCSYYSTVIGTLSIESRVQRIFLSLQRGTAHPDLFLWMDRKVLRQLGTKITCSRDLSTLVTIQHAWCRTYNLDKKSVLEEIGQKLLQGEIVCSKEDRHNFEIYRARFASLTLPHRRRSRGGFEAARSQLRHIKSGKQLHAKRFGHMLRVLTEREREQLFALAKEKGIFWKVERAFYLENIRRAILLCIDPVYHAHYLEKAESEDERELISSISTFACVGLDSYVKHIADVVLVFEELVHHKKRIQNTSFTSFFLKWVTLHNHLDEFQELRNSIRKIAHKIGCSDRCLGLLARSESMIHGVQSGADGNNVLALLQLGSRSQRKEAVGYVARDLFTISAFVFLKSSPLDLSLGKDLTEIASTFNNFFLLITHTILYLPEDLKRAQRISKFWLRVAEKLYEMGDGATSAIIIGALNSTHNSRLAYDANGCLIKNYDEEFKRLSTVFSPEGAHKAYRNCSERMVVPYIAVAKQDIISMKEATSNFGSGGLPQIIAMAGKTIKELLELQDRIGKMEFHKQETNIGSLLSSGISLFEREETKWFERSYELRSRT